MTTLLANCRYIYCIFFCVFVMCGNIYSQGSQKIASDSVKVDNSNTTVAKVPAAKLDKYKSDRNFNYKTKEPASSGFRYYLSRILNKILRVIFSNRGISPYIRYLVAVIILLLAIFLIYKARFKGLFISDKTNLSNNQFAYATENINEKNLEIKLQNAIKDSNFRLAIRFYYILLLKNLDSKNLIQWEIDKTNKDYRYELKDKSIYENFNSLSNLYEYSWYGNFAISEYSFNDYKNSFDLLLKKVGNWK